MDHTKNLPAGLETLSENFSQMLDVTNVPSKTHHSLLELGGDTQETEDVNQNVDEKLSLDKDVKFEIDAEGTEQEEPFDDAKHEDEKEEETETLAETRDRFSDYEIIKILGIGGQGIVLEVKDNLRRNSFALKRISSTTEFEKEAAEREVYLLISMNHKNVTQYQDQWDTESNYDMEYNFYQRLEKDFPDWSCKLQDSFEERYGEDEESEEDSGSGSVPSNEEKLEQIPVKHLVMELCSYDTLEDFMKDLERHRTDQRIVILSIVKQIAEALMHVHERGVMHRDLKPQNIFFALDDKKVVKLGDFGCARHIQLTGDETCMTGSVGTRRYMSPEQRDANPNYTEKCDIYSLGIVFFDLLFPQRASAQEQQRVYDQLKEDYLVPEEVRTRFPDETVLILEMIRMEPEQRPSAFDIKLRVEKMLG